MSMIGSIIAIFLFGITKLFENKLSAKWKCFVLLIPILFLVVPMERIQIQVNRDYTISAVMDKVEDTLSSQDIQEEIVMNTKRKQELQKASVEEQAQKELNSIRIKELLAGVWLLGMILGISAFMIQKMRLGYKIAQSQKVKDSRLANILKQCIVKLKLKRKIEIKLQSNSQSPCICGAFRPTILISKEILEKEDTIIEHVLLHELAHYKRKDMLTNYILLLVTVLHWFNPVVYILFRKMRQEMELATDEVVLSKMNQEKKKQYGFTLLSLLQTYEKERVETKMLCMADDNKNMERRIRKIKFSMKQKKYKISILFFSVLLVMVVLVPFVVKAVNLEEDKLYQQVEQYLTALEEKNAIQEQRGMINQNVEIVSNLKTLVEIRKLGIRQNKEEIYVYVWAMVGNYYEMEEKELIMESGNSIPYKFTIKDKEIIKVEFPEEGERYEETMKSLFPKEMHAQLEEYMQSVEHTQIEKEGHYAR